MKDELKPGSYIIGKDGKTKANLNDEAMKGRETKDEKNEKKDEKKK